MAQAEKFGHRGVAALVDGVEGNVGVIFGLTALPMLLMIGGAVDFARLSTTRASLQQATDSAALMVATKITSTTTDTDAQRMAQVFLQNNYPSATISSATISSDRLSLKLTSSAQIPTTTMKLANFKTMTATITTQASLAGGTDPNTTYEIALVLDNSGSMTESAGGVSKIQSLQTAATSFVNTMFSKVTTGKLQMSITPFNAAVVAVDPVITANRSLSWIDTGGNSSLHWNVFGGSKAAAAADGFTNRFGIYAKLKAARSSWDWNGCFEPQPYPMDVNDTPPTASTPDTLFVPYLSPDEPNNSGYLDSYVYDGSGGSCSSSGAAWTELIHTCKYKNPSVSGSAKGPDGVCPSQSTQILLQLTQSQSTVLNKISNLVAAGTTNLHEGFMWGWRTISPNAPFAAGRAYNAANNRKVMVFMTDGYNNWQSNPGTVTGSQYEAPGYYSLNGAKNVRLPDGSKGDGVDYQTQLAAAAPNNYTDFHNKSRNAQDELTLEACANAKAAGIEIFTIGFSVPIDPIDAQGLALLQSCATNSDHYYTAANADELNAVFASIGLGLGKLRLSL
jgi:Flp pilus assembly protein TadG